MKCLIFVTAHSCRSQLERLTRILVSAFPGSTIYRHSDMLRVPHDVLNNKVDAVFLEAEMGKMNGLDLIQSLHGQKPELSLFIISATEEFRRKAVELGANGYFVLPESEEHLLETMRLAITKVNA